MNDNTKTSDLAEIIAELGLFIEATFVPLSESRNATDNPKIGDLSLNWKIRIKQQREDDSYVILVTDYMQGIAHAPSYKQGQRVTLEYFNKLLHEAETGRVAKGKVGGSVISGSKIKPPKTEDVVFCVVTDSNVLTFENFEDWATDYGFDTDSRKAERIYNECLASALQFYNRLRATPDQIDRLKDAANEY